MIDRCVTAWCGSVAGLKNAAFTKKTGLVVQVQRQVCPGEPARRDGVQRPRPRRVLPYTRTPSRAPMHTNAHKPAQVRHLLEAAHGQLPESAQTDDRNGNAHNTSDTRVFAHAAPRLISSFLSPRENECLPPHTNTHPHSRARAHTHRCSARTSPATSRRSGRRTPRCSRHGPPEYPQVPWMPRSDAFVLWFVCFCVRACQTRGLPARRRGGRR